ncbi:MAG: helix-turn-helix domain-containing protein, partial [Thermoanaerobaculia bacterium]|nr:helix-turn-helix domain-containing protein [Thermoanaerobaculia bacterium]
PEHLHLTTDAGRGARRLREAIDFSGTLPEVVDRATREIERIKIEQALEESEDRQEASRALGVSYRTLLNKIRDYGLE